MKNKNLKKKQRFANWLLNKWNNNIKNDSMYKGCFKVIQCDRYTIPYCDGSGDSEFKFRVNFISTKTNEIIDTSGWIHIYGTDKGNSLNRILPNHTLFEFINDAIVIKAKFWENKERWL